MQEITKSPAVDGNPGGRLNRISTKSAAASALEIKRLKLLLKLFVIGALLIGFAAGVVAMKYRHSGTDTIVAVNGAKITRDDLFDAMQDDDGIPAMRRLISQQLELQYAAKKGLVPTDEEVAARYAELSKQPNFDIIVRNSKLSKEAFRDNLKLSMAQDAIFAKGITVSETEVKQYYYVQTSPKNPKSLFYEPAISTLQAIAVDNLDDAQSAVNQIDLGTPFDLIAQRVSIDGSRSVGGRLSPIVYGQSPLHADPDVESAVFALRPGQLTSPLYFTGHWWIFKCNAYAAPYRIPFSQVQAQARREAEIVKGFNKNGEALKADFAKFTRSANLQAFWPQYEAALSQQ